ncbi:hypothetical protein EZV62_000297 [Acer yangbiense]|uniref:Uncharacterized protein n=1 Tax=Acer yangbiense TaxID=1000413 RepID=A0A5C7IRI4_9ROSI|nr:hypothetical protein EZV62_000297 [Acer yangbiense]
MSAPVENTDPLCSICLEGVSAACGRPVVTLLCSHVFHLGCNYSFLNLLFYFHHYHNSHIKYSQIALVHSLTSMALCNAQTVAGSRMASGSSLTPGNRTWNQSQKYMSL